MDQLTREAILSGQVGHDQAAALMQEAVDKAQAILEGVPDVRITPVGALWHVTAGALSGARGDLFGLCEDLKAQYHRRSERGGIHPAFAEPEPIEIPRFLAPDPLENVPASLLDLAEPGETPHQMQTRLWVLWREMNGKLMLALASPEEIALHTRLHNELHWIAPPLEGET